jgi:hypothetical protein
MGCKFGNIVQEVDEWSVEWFKCKMGLSIEGLDIRKDLNDSHVSMEECECLLGPKKSKNGFKVTNYIEQSVVAQI